MQTEACASDPLEEQEDQTTLDPESNVNNSAQVSCFGSVDRLPRLVAQELGAIEARILKFIAWKVSRSKNIRDGERYWWGSIVKEIAPRFPFLNVERIRKILFRLEKKGFIKRTAKYNRRKGDRTYWYTVPADQLIRVNRKLVSYFEHDAVRFDLESALILFSMTLQIANRRLVESNCDNCSFSPTAMSKYLGMSLSTMKMRLKELARHGVIERVAGDEASYRLLDRLEERVAHLPASLMSIPKTKEEAEPVESPYGQIQPLTDEELARRLADIREEGNACFASEDALELAQDASRQLRELLSGLSDRELVSLINACSSLSRTLPVVERLCEVRGVRFAAPSLGVDGLLRVIGQHNYKGVTDGDLVMPDEAVKAFWTRFCAAIRRINEEDHNRKVAENRSAYEKYENESGCSADLKASTVLAGLRARNVYGVKMRNNVYAPNLFTFRSTDRLLLTEFFLAHPRWSAGNLLWVMEKCGPIALYPKLAEVNDWHARQASNPTFMLRYLPMVLRQINAPALWAHRLNEEWLRGMDESNALRNQGWND